MKPSQTDPICNDMANDAARRAFEQFLPSLETQIASLKAQLSALIQAKHVLQRIYEGGEPEDLKGELNTIGAAMREAAKEVSEGM